MNDKIYRMATEAGAYCETYLHGGDPKPPILDNMDLEKFAQLIVLECADIASINQYQPYSAGHYVKKHFGFE